MTRTNSLYLRIDWLTQPSGHASRLPPLVVLMTLGFSPASQFMPCVAFSEFMRSEPSYPGF